MFDGRPSRRSDQYSLAIVYQEMLTGVLPFPGRTAAQLAAQHLNAKPRLSALPPNDQPVIARALSKKPADRFNSCRELVDALVEAGKQASAPAAARPQPAGDVRMTAAPGGSVSGSAATAAPRTHAQMLSELEQASRTIDVAVTGDPAADAPGPMTNRIVAPAADAAAPALALADLGPAPPLVDLPPSNIDATAWQPRPTLFVGIGGTGARILASLRRRLDDRLCEAGRTSFPMLVLDTDSRDLATAAHSGHLRSDETLALPLRRSQDYRNDSREILQWLSRRWLYNIPRSQLTEGMRPLGRLALVDHAEQALPRLRAAVAELARSVAPGQPAPRVVIVAAPSGGTGGGMTTDIVFATRQYLDEQGLAQADLLTVLPHGTGRNPQQQELAAVNSLATLTELAQFHRTPFPGDRACGLAARSADVPALRAAYLVHLGEELSPEQFLAGCDRVAEFLLLDTITSTGAALESARAEPGTGDERLRVRTFGLVQVGFAHDGLVDQAVHRISRGVVERWLGEPKRNDCRKSMRLVPGGSGPPSGQAVLGPPLADIDARTDEIQRQFGLALEPLMKIVERLAVDEMGGDAEAFFRGLIELPAKEVQRTALDGWLAAAGDLFGFCRDENTMQTPASRLKQALEGQLTALVAQLGRDLRPAIESLVDQPALRVHGRQRVAKALQVRLKQAGDEFREARNRLQHEARCCEQQLWLSAVDPKSKTKGPRRSPAEMQALFVQCCLLRLHEFCARRPARWPTRCKAMPLRLTISWSIWRASCTTWPCGSRPTRSPPTIATRTPPTTRPLCGGASKPSCGGATNVWRWKSISSFRARPWPRPAACRRRLAPAEPIARRSSASCTSWPGKPCSSNWAASMSPGPCCSRKGRSIRCANAWPARSLGCNRAAASGGCCASCPSRRPRTSAPAPWPPRSAPTYSGNCPPSCPTRPATWCCSSRSATSRCGTPLPRSSASGPTWPSCPRGCSRAATSTGRPSWAKPASARRLTPAVPGSPSPARRRSASDRGPGSGR